MDKFRPEEDAVDRRIYYGITNRKIDPTEKFSDESDDDSPTNQMMRYLEKSSQES